MRKENILKILKLLRTRPDMILYGKINYNSYEIYLHGFIEGVSQVIDRSLNKELSLKLSGSNKVHWSVFVSEKNEKMNEEEKRELLISEVEKFFKDLNCFD